jgi:uncharacterized protein Yka (UPF0111/DUF47 family)
MVEERLARMEDLLNQLIGLVAKTNSGLIDLESRLNQRIDGLEQRMDGLEQQLNRRIDGLEQRLEPVIEGQRRDVTVLKSESDHLARKVGVIERDLAVLRGQS